jgi:prephenate dehydratase
LISQPDVYVVGEVILPIRQTLMGIPGASLEDIQTIYSHPQGIKQSEQWRKENLPDAVCQEMDSTAAAASYAAELRDPSVAAIAAPAAAELYGLTVLAQNVQITDSNKTRFYILSMEMPDLEGRTRTAFVADLEASQIDDLMITIHDTGLEVVTIHDRPEGSRLGRYHYLIELEDVGGITKEQIRQLEDLEDLRLFGCFDMIEKAG